MKMELLESQTLIQSSSLWRSAVVAAFILLALLSLIVHISRAIRSDYAAFIKLGPGGTPSTPLGYMKICLLKLFVAHSPSQVLMLPPGKTTDRPSPYFQDDDAHQLPKRKGSRPRIEGIAPQRQLSQTPSRSDVVGLADLLAEMVRQDPVNLQAGNSCFEKNNLALFLGPGRRSVSEGRMTEQRLATTQKTKHASSSSSSSSSSTRFGPLRDSSIPVMNQTCGSPPEIAHMHDSEGSLHLVLHPSDAARVINQGWGQKHPLAGTGGFIRDFFNGRFYKIFLGEGPREGWLPRGFVLIYAPRDAGEREVVRNIIQAATWWVGGIRIGKKAGS